MIGFSVTVIPVGSNGDSISDWMPYLIILVPVLTTAIVQIINAFKVKDIKKELKTMNESTLGELGEANEARRIAKIPLVERTPQEKRHMGMTNTNTSDITQSTVNEELE
jgi:uncharacterized protein YqgV (UPF0045/DUF77 family)